MLEGLDGVKKMSKSLGNCIGIQEAPGSVAASVVSIPGHAGCGVTLNRSAFRLLDEIDSFARTSRRAPTRVTSRSSWPRRSPPLPWREEARRRAHTRSAGNRLRGELTEDLPEIELSSPRGYAIVASWSLSCGGRKNAAGGSRDLLGAAAAVKVGGAGRRLHLRHAGALGETRVFAG
ncbi:hypothetical protein ACPA9J_35940 [Pseudomonas aeruginosa]